MVIILLWRVWHLWKRISSARKTPALSHKVSPIYTSGARVFFSRPIAGVLHTVLVVAMIIMTTYSIIQACGVRNHIWDITAGICAVAAIIAAIIFIMRRCWIRPARFSTLTPAMAADAYIILFLEIISGATLIASQYDIYGFHTAHYMTLVLFAIYITYSKHLHIITAWIYRYLNRGRGAYDTERVNGVCMMMDMMEGNASSADVNSGTMGSNHVSELSRLDTLGIYSCSRCGRCEELCPPHIVGEDFSPMETTIRIKKAIEKKSAFYPDFIDDDFISRCISCGACVAACPIGINPMKVLWEIKRYAYLEKGHMPSSYHTASQSTQNSRYPLPTYIDRK